MAEHCGCWQKRKWLTKLKEWVSDDAEPWRTECKESNKRFSKQFQQLAAMQVQQAQTEQQLREAREAAATATAAAAAAGKGVRAGKGGVAGGASGGGPHGFGIDTRMLGRPDTFDGSESKWCDWSTVMKAYAALCNASLVSAMPASEVEAQEKRNSDLRDQLDVEASVALY